MYNYLIFLMLMYMMLHFKFQVPVSFCCYKGKAVDFFTFVLYPVALL